MTRRTAQQVSDALAATPVPTGNEPCRGALDIFYPPVGASLPHPIRRVTHNDPHRPHKEPEWLWHTTTSTPR